MSVILWLVTWAGFVLTVTDQKYLDEADALEARAAKMVKLDPALSGEIGEDRVDHLRRVRARGVQRSSSPESAGEEEK